ncbi:DUF3885 domain-containing protein [Listeria booriae]|uniref:DUF3885 domain-containing protein n=1 Tax=Listeria booriae TaxID=1552123 RepID=UPI001623BAB6|nr:DUF3885 domain-containing protein [Listeria booriae]MBC1943762.1 DUF3885 domain-containing protein [Listeria booriae]MBC6165417.1 DUF3885 domain-containing protein [Listeria booriae]
MYSLSDELKKYIKDNFGKTELSPPLFYNSSIGIRFELGEDRPGIEEKKYMKRVYNRSLSLFNEIFSSNDSIFLVWIAEPSNKEKMRTTGVLKKYIKRSTLKYYIDAEKIRREEGVFLKMVLKCQVKDIRIEKMLEAIANQDMNIHPRLMCECYFINIEKKIIYYMYDDRGLDIVASSADELISMYKLYEEWILSYNKDEVIRKLGLDKDDR